MKKFVSLMLCAAIALTLFGCKGKDDLGKQTTIDKENGYTIVEELLRFKFNKDEESLTEENGAILSGFKTSEDSPAGPVRSKTDAIEIAKKDVSVDFNKIVVYFDRTRGIWKIVFSTDTTKTAEDGSVTRINTVAETIYVDEDGYTIGALMGQ